jgi:hypothetical protein
VQKLIGVGAGGGIGFRHVESEESEEQTISNIQQGS